MPCLQWPTLRGYSSRTCASATSGTCTSERRGLRGRGRIHAKGRAAASGDRTMVRYGPVNIAFHEPDDDVVCPAKPRGALGHRVEHRLGIGGRAADDRRISAVAVCCSSDSVVCVARLQLLEQPHVLDRDHGLSGKRSSSLICLSVNGRTSSRRMTITPIAVSSRTSGAARKDRNPAATMTVSGYSSRTCASATSGICTVRASNTARPPMAARVRMRGARTGIGPWCATAR